MRTNWCNWAMNLNWPNESSDSNVEQDHHSLSLLYLFGGKYINLKFSCSFFFLPDVNYGIQWVQLWAERCLFVVVSNVNYSTNSQLLYAIECKCRYISLICHYQTSKMETTYLLTVSCGILILYQTVHSFFLVHCHGIGWVEFKTIAYKVNRTV